MRRPLYSSRLAIVDAIAGAPLPPMDELVRLFADYGCDILGPPPELG